MTEEISIQVNGDPYRLTVGGSVLSLLDALGHDPRTVAIELNGEVLSRSRFGAVELSAGDRVEVVRFVQGGCERGSLAVGSSAPRGPTRSPSAARSAPWNVDALPV